MADNTLVILMSDSGANKTGSNFPFSVYKGNLFEGGIRVPYIVKWLGVVREGMVSNQRCITRDFPQSIVRAAGAKPPKNCLFDGIDILRVVETKQPVQKRTLFWRARRGQLTRKAIRNGSLKYIRLQEVNNVKEYLFDNEENPAEKNKLFRG